MKLWVVGKALSEKGAEEYQWEFFGVFDTQEKAEAVCKDENYFVGSVELNDVLPDETVPWPGAYYPLVKEETNKEKR